MIKLSLSKIEEAMETMDSHIPVMHREVIESLNISPNAVIVDCTLGLAGHSKMIVEKMGPEGKLIGIDRDNQSLAKAKENLGDCEAQCEFAQHQSCRRDSYGFRDIKFSIEQSTAWVQF